jgi:hypothetical protein
LFLNYRAAPDLIIARDLFLNYSFFEPASDYSCFSWNSDLCFLAFPQPGRAVSDEDEDGTGCARDVVSALCGLGANPIS